jgi:hypothetical protein
MRKKIMWTFRTKQRKLPNLKRKKNPISLQALGLLVNFWSYDVDSMGIYIKLNFIKDLI